MVILTLVFWVKNKAPLYENTRSRDVESVRLAFAASSPRAQPLAASTNYLLTLSPQAHTQHTLAQTRKNRLRLTAFLLAERQHTK